MGPRGGERFSRGRGDPGRHFGGVKSKRGEVRKILARRKVSGAKRGKFRRGDAGRGETTSGRSEAGFEIYTRCLYMINLTV